VASAFAALDSDKESGTPLSFAPAPAAANKKGGYSYSKKYQRSKLSFDQAEGLADKRRLLLTTGEDKAIDLNFDANMTPAGISYGNPLVVTATLAKIGDQKQVILKPLKAGETTVTIRDNEGHIGIIFVVRVTGSNLLRIKGEISDLLRDIEGLNIRVVGPKVVVEGEVLVPTDYGRLFAVISDKAYADFVLNLTVLSPLAIQFLATRIHDDIVTFAPNVRTRVVNGMIFLEGLTDSLDQARRAASIASLYLPEMKPGTLLDKDVSSQRMAPRNLIQNFIMVNPPPQKKNEKLVRVTLHFVELSKDYGKVFGFKWAPGFTSDPYVTLGQNAAGAGAASSGASFGGTISSLLPKIQSAQTAGFARVLKTGTIIVRSGQVAKLTEQTKFPFLVSGPNGQISSQSTPVGLAASVTPVILGQSQDIQMDLDLDQSDLVGRAPSTGAAPVVATHTVNTKIFLKSNESAAIAGINSNQIGTDFNKDDPGAGSFDQSGSSGGGSTIPLFQLLHSKNYRKQKSNFVIFVTPQIVENASEGTEDLKKNFRVKVN
jgi:pilus assembly protein CpaC